MEKGLIHLYHGDGKGKTTAAVGLCIRAAGNKKRVLFVQFMKDNSSGEITVLEKIPGIKIMHGNIPKGFYSKMADEEKKIFALEQEKLLEQVVEEIGSMKDGGLVVLDEITYAYSWKLILREKLEDLLVNKPEGIELVMTGRNPERLLVKSADYVTEMKCEKHPFEKGIRARRGIEF
ncbi:MAG: cob(I)yrinic acid a,c-diamide adenosyltransferase [Lachnospiraceae bacterium]|nr:cob(I)yrinic acid a,c-diamide adenosyltransferase [Lachnospiraceae bacterium]